MLTHNEIQDKTWNMVRGDASAEDIGNAAADLLEHIERLDSALAGLDGVREMQVSNIKERDAHIAKFRVALRGMVDEDCDWGRPGAYIDYDSEYENWICGYCGTQAYRDIAVKSIMHDDSCPVNIARVALEGSNDD